jgi:hypothetical protein
LYGLDQPDIHAIAGGLRETPQAIQGIFKEGAPLPLSSRAAVDWVVFIRWVSAD